MPGRSTFSRMCDELSQSLSPRLEERGFTLPREPFSRHTVKYEFTRQTSSGVHVLEIQFNKYRKPAFSVQIYVAPPSGLSTLIAEGGSLVIGSVSPSPRRWPFPVQPFRAAPTRLQRVLGASGDHVEDAVQSFLSLVPEVEDWWAHQRASRHIIVSTLRYRGARHDA